MRISDWSSDVCSSDLVARIATDGDGQGRTKKRPGARIPAGLPADSGPLRTVYWWRWRLPNGAPETASPCGSPGTRRGQCPQKCPHVRSEEQPSELQPLMSIQYTVFCMKKKTNHR